MFEKISRFLSEYKVLKIKLDNRITFKTMLKSVFGSVLINFLIFLIPALIIYNLFVFVNLVIFLEILVVILMILFSFSFHYFFITLLKNYHENLEIINFKIVLITDGTITALFLTICTIVFMSVL